MYKPKSLVRYIRDGLIEQEHYGFIVYSNNKKIGDDCDYPFYLRSCAKPLQASLLIDYGLDKEFCMTEQEIAICCASHAGEKVHVGLVKGLLDKFGIGVEKLKCGKHQPISISAQKELLLAHQPSTALHNNCSGKHAMMLGLCKIKGWDLDSYYQLEHSLQQEIKRKVNELCEVKENYPITKDGCGVPIFSMPLKNILCGYLNLFCNDKYEKIKNAFLNNPYIIGGENRTDTKIITQTDGIVAKVGAGGLCVVINTKIKEGFVVKICDANMEAREVVVADLIKSLNWGEVNVSHDIKTLHNDKVGEIVTLCS